MTSEAIDALANGTMRPQAPEAAAMQNPEQGTQQAGNGSSDTKPSQSPEKLSVTPNKPSTPFGERTDGIESAAKVVEEVVHGVKAAVDGALTWAEKKADELSAEQDSMGPYTSPATCVPSDLDAIAGGILPAMPTQAPSEGDVEGNAKNGKE